MGFDLSGPSEIYLGFLNRGTGLKTMIPTKKTPHD